MDGRKYIPNGPEEFKSLEDFRLPDFPLHVDVELTSRCNLNCVFCDKQPLLKAHQLGDMSYELFKKIADECGKMGLQGMGLSYRGEPLLHRRIIEFIYYAKSKGIGHISLCTNGMLLVPVTARRLIQAGLDEITVSAQGATRETFEYSRLGSNFHTVLRNVEELIKIRDSIGIRDSRGGKKPLIRIQAVDLPQLDRNSFYSFWTSRCDIILIIPFEDSLDRQAGIDTDWCCPQPWRRITIEWDGTILPCANSDLRFSSPGNAKEMSIMEAWHSPEMKKLRKYHRLGKSREIPDCDGCPFRRVAIEMV